MVSVCVYFVSLLIIYYCERNDGCVYVYTLLLNWENL